MQVQGTLRRRSPKCGGGHADDTWRWPIKENCSVI
jgi:hypothetical protein